MVWREKTGRTGVRDTSLCRKQDGAKQTGFRLQTTEPSGIPPLRCDGSTCRFSLTTGSTAKPDSMEQSSQPAECAPLNTLKWLALQAMKCAQ